MCFQFKCVVLSSVIKSLAILIHSSWDVYTKQEAILRERDYIHTTFVTVYYSNYSIMLLISCLT